jgi:hypothetical protein
MGPEAEIFWERWNADFENNLAKIEKQLETPYEWKEFDPLRIEIAQCLLSGLSLAAITSTNLLLELFLKVLLIYHDTRPSASYCLLDTERFKEHLGKYSSGKLSKNIKSALGYALITHQEARQIGHWKKEFRDPFAHSDIKQIMTNNSAMIGLVGPNLVSKSKKEAYKYFIDVDQLIKAVISRNNKLHPANNR